MSYEYFYHYTTKKGAKKIMLSGKIEPSLRANGNAIHGDGVYLTTVDPLLGKETVSNNNWDGLARSSSDKMERYIEIRIPSDEVRRAREKRDIQVYTGGELKLSNYSWSLKSWEGQLIATQYFMVRSQGGATRYHSERMGRYTLCQNIVTTGSGTTGYTATPVYKQDEGNNYLYYLHQFDKWCVGPVAGDTSTGLSQRSDQSPSPHKTIPWKYGMEGKSWDDDTLKVYPCYY